MTLLMFALKVTVYFFNTRLVWSRDDNTSDVNKGFEYINSCLNN